MGRIFCFEIEGKPSLCFDTGLDSRSFAQAKLARFVNSPGLIVLPGGTVETWTPRGAAEISSPAQTSPSVVIWGPPFAGEGLDLLIEDNSRRDEALAAIGCWIQARLSLGDRYAPLAPHAALVALSGGPSPGAFPPGTVFFAPEELALRCAGARRRHEGISGGEQYLHPDISGPVSAAFCAAAMLYRVLLGSPPFPAAGEIPLREDMREGNFLPPALAAPGLEPATAALIQAALRPAKGGGPEAGKTLLAALLAAIRRQGEPPRYASFFRLLAEGERQKQEKEKERFLKRKTASVKRRRFITRNRAVILGCAAALAAALLGAGSIVKGHAGLPGTAGMNGEEVIASYYRAFGELDHAMMDACTAKGAGKDDIGMVTSLFVISKVRQAYEMNRAPAWISAESWEASGGGPGEARVFGVTGLRIEPIKSGGEEPGPVRFRAAYTLWLPEEAGGPEEAAGLPGTALPRGVPRTDELTLDRVRGNWRITKILRVPR